jgi:hypothetical protein
MNIGLDVENTLKILVSALFGYGACRIVLMLVEMNPWFELILGGSTLAIIYLVSVILTGALSAKNIRDIKSITDRVESTRTITYPIYKQLLRLARE